MTLAQGLKRYINLIDTVGKNKLARWAELGTFGNVIQPAAGQVSSEDHTIKGRWRERIFANKNPVVLELACGKGEYTLGLAAIFPERNYIGIDIKGARMWRGAKTASEKELRNTAFLRTRIEFIGSFFTENEVDEIWIVFPDPHNRKRNSNKRLTSPWFLNKYRFLMKDGGLIHLKTDNAELFHYTEKLVKNSGLEILKSTGNMYGGNHDGDLQFFSFLPYIAADGKNDMIPEKILSLRTHYENMFLEKGLNICYLTFKMNKKAILNDEWQETSQ